MSGHNINFKFVNRTMPLISALGRQRRKSRLLASAAPRCFFSHEHC